MNLKKTSKKLCVGIVVLDLFIGAIYSFRCYLDATSQIEKIDFIQELKKISRSASILNDKETIYLISKANQDGKTTQKEFDEIKVSYTRFISVNDLDIKSVEWREKKFMERRAEYLSSKHE